ncbi:MAG: 2-oxoacid:acceptor oxidoreductase family protein [Candidatus Zixiibacteriota bacterium]
MNKPQFPGQSTTMDGGDAVVWVEVHAASGAASYPITPSSSMGAGFQLAVANGRKNLWGDRLVFIEPESEHSAASACEGYAVAGGRVTNFTSGQGLILMKEVLYTIAGKRLPVIFNIGARAMTVHSLNVHAGHDDVMGVADCGWGMIFARNAQEATDFCLIARRTAEESFTPFFNVQDGFLTTHTVEDLLLPEPELIKTYLKSPTEALVNLIDPDNPIMSGTVQNQDAYMRGKIAQRAYYALIKDNLKANLAEFARLTGRSYGLIDAYGMEDARYAIVGMGSYMETARATVRALRKNTGEKIGVVTLHSYRPFPGPELVEALKNVEVVSILERMDDSAAPENPLARDVKAAFSDAMWGHEDYPSIERTPVIQHGAGGLGSFDVRARDFQAIIENLKRGKEGKIRYCIGIRHEDALTWDKEELDIRPDDYFAMRGYSIGGYGSITTNKVIATVCNELFGLSVQAYPKYGAEKKGMPTMYFLAVASKHIESHQELNRVDFIAINDVNVFHRGDPLNGLSEGGAVFLQTSQDSAESIWAELPEAAREEIRRKKARLYGLDATAIANEVARTPDLVNRMQGIALLGVFLKVTPLAMNHGLSEEQALTNLEAIIRKYFGKRGEQAVEDNMTCIKKGFREVIEVPVNQWENAQYASESSV